MAKLTIKQLECKLKYYLKWFFISCKSHHGHDCVVGTVLFKDSKCSVVLTPDNLYLVDDHYEFSFGIPSDFVSLDLHKVTLAEYNLEYANMVNFLLSCNSKQLEYVIHRWSDRTHFAIDKVEDFIHSVVKLSL